MCANPGFGPGAGKDLVESLGGCGVEPATETGCPISEHTIELVDGPCVVGDLASSTATAVRALAPGESPLIVIWEELTVFCAANSSQSAITVGTDDPTALRPAHVPLRYSCLASGDDRGLCGKYDDEQGPAKAMATISVKCPPRMTF